MPRVDAALPSFLSQLVERSSLRGAVAGNGSGLVNVPARPNYIYGRLGSAQGPVAEIHVSVIQPNNGDYILIEKVNPKVLGGWRMAFWLRDATDPTAPAPVG